MIYSLLSILYNDSIYKYTDRGMTTNKTNYYAAGNFKLS